MILPPANKKAGGSISSALSSFPAELLGIVVDVAHPGKVYLLGQLNTNEVAESIFGGKNCPVPVVSRYYLLVLCEQSREDQFTRLRDRIEQRAKAITAVTVVMCGYGEFCGWLEIGDRFASTVAVTATPLYENTQVALPEPAAPDSVKANAGMESCYRSTLLAGREFLAGARLFELRSQYRFGAFMLHQALEQVLRGCIELGTGYRSVTHNLDILYNLAILCDAGLLRILPRASAEDEALFRLLQSAYINARYRDYEIRGRQLKVLAGRLQSLLDWYESWGVDTIKAIIAGM